MRQRTTTPHYLWTVPDVCQYLAVSDTTVYRLVADGSLPAYRLKQRLRFEPEDVKRMIREGAK